MKNIRWIVLLAGMSCVMTNIPQDKNTVRAEAAVETEISIEVEMAEAEKQAEAGEAERQAETEAAEVGIGEAENGTEMEKMAVVYLADYYAVRATPRWNGDEVVVVPSGQTVMVDSCGIYDGEAWFAVHFWMEEKEYRGYIQESYLAYSDERLREWKQENVVEEDGIGMQTLFGTYADIEQFPTSYQYKLRRLKEAHPNWIFVKMNTGLDWEEVVWNEKNPASRSLVPDSSPAVWKDGSYGQGWSYASQDILEYYLDPRNFLEKREIFQFEQLTYNASYHTQEAVQSFLDKTFMAGDAADGSGSYAALFTNIGQQLGVSPFHLASRAYQEQGKGTSPLISGAYPGYEGYYNYFNIGASGSTNKEVIESGLKRAKKEGWSSVYASLYGGAQILAKNYILKGQDTIYLQKFDVDNQYSGMYWHQYMQNICAPTSEAYSIYNLYSNTDSVDNTFVFKIPVYENMPENASGKPVRYDDVSKEAWYYDYVCYVYTQGLMSGKSTNLFAPNDKLTRAEFATILYNAAGTPEVSYRDIFTDVPQGEWYTDAVLWANQAGIVSGYGSGSFGTTDVVTREQLVVMLKNFGMYEGRDMTTQENVQHTFTDVSSVSSWATDAMKWAVSKGMLSGKGSLLAPQEGATRAEAATILYHYMAQGYAPILDEVLPYPERKDNR